MSRDAGRPGQCHKGGEYLHRSRVLLSSDSYIVSLYCELGEHGAGEEWSLTPYIDDWQRDRHWYWKGIVSMDHPTSTGSGYGVK